MATDVNPGRDFDGHGVLVAPPSPLLDATKDVSDPLEVSSTLTRPEWSSRAARRNPPVLPIVVEPSWLHTVAPGCAYSSATVCPASEAGAEPRRTTSCP